MTIEKRTRLLEKVNSKKFLEVIKELDEYINLKNSYYFRSIVKISCLYFKFEKDKNAGILLKRDRFLIEDFLVGEIIDTIIGIYDEQSSQHDLDVAIQNLTKIKGKYWHLKEDERLFEIQKYFKKSSSYFKSELSYLISERNEKIDKFRGDEELYRKNKLTGKLLDLIDKVLLEKDFLKNDGIEKMLSYSFISQSIQNFKISNIESGFNKIEEFILLQRNLFYKTHNFDNFLRLRRLDRQIGKLALEYEISHQESINGAIPILYSYITINQILITFFNVLEEHIINFNFDMFKEIKEIKEIEEEKKNFDYIKHILNAKKLIGNFEIKKVFKILDENEVNIPAEMINDIILIKSRWNKNEKRKRLGIDYESNYENIISFSLIEIIDEIINSAANKGYDVHSG